MKQVYYGGQAVIEGVMIRGGAHAAVAARSPGGEIVTHIESLPEGLYQSPVGRLPLLRGLVMLWEMLILGTRALLFSANVQARRSADADIPRSVILMMIATSLTFVVLVFFLAPLLVVRSAGSGLHSALLGNAVEGVLRLLLFIGYLALISRLPRVRTLFQYHGAEHKTVNAFEHEARLTPADVDRFSTIHIRCGTAFLLWVVVVSILVFSLIGHSPILLGILSRVILIPLIAGIGYEILRLGARYYGFGPVRMVLQPGLWLQRLTTRQPSLGQIEVAIAAMEAVLRAEAPSRLLTEEPPVPIVQPVQP
jgi:uncharacterized protein YqhQ